MAILFWIVWRLVYFFDADGECDVGGVAAGGDAVGDVAKYPGGVVDLGFVAADDGWQLGDEVGVAVGEGYVKAGDAVLDFGKGGFCAAFGGGGHPRAAGFEWQGKLSELKKALLEKIGEQL